MADSAVSSVLELLYQLLREEGSLLKGLGNDFSDIKQELESIKAFLKDADRRAGDHEGVKTWVIFVSNLLRRDLFPFSISVITNICN